MCLYTYENRETQKGYSVSIHTIQWPEETYTETNIDLSSTTQNIQQKHGDLNNSFFMITMYMYLFN